ncbi:MAG: ATP-binding protein [Sulfitobacter sp.]
MRSAQWKGTWLRLPRRMAVLLIAICLLSFSTMLVIAWQFDRQQTRLELISERRAVAELGDQLGHAIENEINKRLLAVEALVAFQSIQPDINSIDQTEFNDFASVLEAGDENVIALQLAPNGIVAYTTQPQRNADAIGHNLLTDPERSEKALRSIETGEYNIVGPVELIQGGAGLVARKPIYQNGKVGREHFWGFATVVLDFHAITNVLTHTKAFETHHFALRDKKVVSWGDPQVFEADPFLVNVHLTAGNWQLAVLPHAGWPTAWPFATGFRIASVITAALLSIMLFSLLRKPKQLRQAVRIATRKIHLTSQRLREVHRIVQLGAWELNEDGTLFWSKEALKILGLDQKPTFTGLDVLYELAHKDDLAVLRSEIEEIPYTDARTEFTFRLKAPPGEHRSVRLTAIAQVLQDGQRQYSGTVQDVSVEAMNSERLRRAQRLEAIGQLTGGVAHDFNNLLAVIQGNTELMEMEGRYDQGLLDEISQASRKGAALTHRLLAYARKQPLSCRPTNLVNLVRGMHPILSRSIGEDIIFEMAFEDNLWEASVDPGQIEDAILNLAINARDAMTNGGRLTIKVQNLTFASSHQLQNVELDPGEYVVLNVTDTGAGMSEHVQMHAFEPFFSTKGVGGGSGLGLSMVCGLARQTGGGVGLVSELGRGTTIKIYLPRSIEKTRPTIPPPPSDIQVPRANGELILVIEDNPSVKLVVVKNLRRLGYTTLSAETVDAAFAQLALHPDIELVLSDIVLPGGASGLDFAARAKAEGNDIQIIFMSGYPVSPNAGSDAPMSEHTLLKKPFGGDELAVAVHEALKQRQPVPPIHAPRTSGGSKRALS